MKTTSKKIALVTGSNRGLGFETARELCENGVHVILGTRNATNGADAVSRLAAQGLEATAVTLDMTDESTHLDVRRHIENTYGRLDILVNNAAVYLDNVNASDRQPNHTSTTELKIIRTTFEANFFGVVALTQILLPLIRKSSAGRIVNVSSIVASLTLHSQIDSPIVDSKAFAYNSSKAALNAFTVHLAHELKDTTIKVNSAHPGWVKTEMGGTLAMMDVHEGGKTSVQLALLPDNGPTGGFFHLNQELPW